MGFDLDGDRRNMGGDAGRDAALMRELARRNALRGAARSGLRRREADGLARTLERVRRLRRVERVEDDALAALASQARVIGALARRASGEGGARLPAWNGRPRIEVAMERLVALGDAALDRDRLIGAVAALDAAQPLTMAELWAIPAALRTALARALLFAAGSVARRAECCAAAGRWAHGRRVGRPDRALAFAEYALKLAGEEGLPGIRARLETELARRGLSPEEAVTRTQAERARDALRLQNLLAARRMLDALDWQDAFDALSRVERELREDPAGTYPRMDDDSRAAARRELARIARRLRLSEIAVARCAVDAARCEAGVRGGACWWLYDDRGRGALAGKLGRHRARLPRRVPDPSGRRTMMAIALLAALAGWALTACAGVPLLWPACAVLGWGVANALAGRVLPRLVPPARLLKLELETLPDDCRTLVALPALLSGPERAAEVCERLEALGCLEQDTNMRFLLLGDLADADAPTLPGDGAILDAARTRLAAMNARAGWEKYALLCRPRTLLEPDGVWMGRDRKRGALMDLNRLLLGAAGAENAFAVEGAACAALRAARFAYVITLDADTRMLPGDARRLVGAMAHPLNRFAVLQPRMETLPSGCRNGFARLFAGTGGVNAYPVSVSNLWQDATGRGIYAGKGIYDVAAFAGALEGALPEGRILSHALIEGAIAGAGFAGDVALYDGYPGSLSAFLARLHRWTRGDWQLLPLLLRRGPLPNGRRLAGADRFRMLDNLIRSLQAPVLLCLLICAAWTGSGDMLLAALIVNYLEPLLYPAAGEDLWRRATARLAALPAFAWCGLDAMLRTLWRLGVSGKKLMQWVTAADAEGSRGVNAALPGRVAALLLIPGLLAPGRGLMALALAALFLAGPGWIGDMERDGAGEAPLTARQRDVFVQLARDTWRFFADNMPTGGAALPPDNVQLDPPVGAARRTSPTNIALYLLSCLSARRLGFIDAPEMEGRMAAALEDVRRLEKWRGHLYNWYDIDTLAPLRPRYVSSVDSGNLAAALLLCANAPEVGPELSDRLRALAREMDFAALYDGDRELFRIGVDAETGRASASHYDLLASEARILSFTAMLLGQVPTRHWGRLGRSCVRLAGGVAPLSWAGTLFEYLMPELLMPAPAHTLLGEGVRAAVAAQIAQGRRTDRPWGVSESGYNALDAALNYQYRAFGLRALALDGEAVDGVVAPYAAALATMVAPEAAARNLERMRDMGWSDEWGLYEAADYLHNAGGDGPALVKSHMAHHQGMALCALCNALTGNSLARDFMAQPEARALAPLLEERPCRDAGPRRSRDSAPDGPMPPEPRMDRRPDPEALAPQTHLLSGGGATALWTDDGAVHYVKGGVCATRFEGALQDRAGAARLWLTDLDAGETLALGEANTRWAFAPGAVRGAMKLNGIEARLGACLSPEDGTLLRVVELRNAGELAARLALSDVVPVALAPERDWRAHGAFQNLFVTSRPLEGGGLLLRRRPGSRGADGPRLAHLAVGPGEITRESDWEALAGRCGDPRQRLGRPLSGGTGDLLNPASALRLELTLEPGQSARACFALALLDGEADAKKWLARWRDGGQPERVLRLSEARARSLLGFIGLNAARHGALQQLSALLFDGALAAQARGGRGGGPAPVEALWPLGISGDLPLLMLWARRDVDADTARELVRAHEFYRAAGIQIDLVLVDDGDDGYARPLRDALEALIASSHLNGLRGVPGGAWLLDGDRLTGEQRCALLRRAAASFGGGGDLYAQIRRLLAALRGPRRSAYRPMDIGASALEPASRLADNGYGGFLPDERYEIDVAPGRLPPAPWCDLLANDAGGLLLSERGGGFFWRGNSRSGRLTPYGNDAQREGWGLMLYLVDEARGEALRLLPGARPDNAFRVRFGRDDISFAFRNRRAAGEARFAMADGLPEALIDVRLENRGLRGESLWLWGHVDWLMGTDRRDAVALECRWEGGACLAEGAMDGAGYFAAADALAQPGPGRCAFLGRGDVDSPEGFAADTGGQGWTLRVPLRLKRGEARTLRLALGWAEDARAAMARVRALRTGKIEAAREPEGLTIETPDAALNAFANGFLLHQVRASRVLGRAGLCQPGGAWGFRDQLQDMLALLHSEPGRVRAHLLRCAGRQFEAGDVLHWWHAPCSGVRTRVSDDRLFLPWVTAAYVKYTGDGGVLEERASYLEDVPLPDGAEDVYREMRPGRASASLHEHCMAAFRASARFGPHGLLLMGTGDWNDGMNRLGAKGRGESVWLSQFAVACADRYRAVAPEESDRAWLAGLSARLRNALEEHGWDGGWYLRAYADDGAKLGGADCAECRIDAISQAWAELAGLDRARCRMALEAAREQLIDEEAGIVRLLTPPFEGRGIDPGYIRGYPPGVRENGGQYTHGALWLLLALIHAGDAAMAHRVLGMLLPYNHSDDPDKARVYRVEPYVMAADVDDHPEHRGRGGWTWYTGAAGWMYDCLLALLGFERRGDSVWLSALLGDWPEAGVTLPFGNSVYHLMCDKKTVRATLDGHEIEGDYVRLIDDGKRHEARFPGRGQGVGSRE